MGPPKVIASDDPTAADAAASSLAAGDTVVLPTDTVYGLAVAAGVDGATARLYAAKDRPIETAVAVLVADADQASALAAEVPPWARKLIDRGWPGPLTLVLRRRQEGSTLDLGGDPTTIGVRCPDHQLVRALARRLGPLAVTSANRHGEPTPQTALDAAAALAVAPAVVVDGGPCRGTASTVVDATGSERRVLRVGAISAAELDRLVG